MKTVKFRPHLVDEIKAGQKTATWRLYDDKDLKVGDEIELLNWATGEKFAEATITSAREKKLSELEEADFHGHEKFSSRDEMLTNYREYYGDTVTWETLVKMLDFKIDRFV
jgi:hypothetical protein